MRHERLLHLAPYAIDLEALDLGDLCAFALHREREARVDPLAIQQHRAGTTGTMVTPLLGACQVEVLTQAIQKTDAGIEDQVVATPFTCRLTGTATSVVRRSVPSRGAGGGFVRDLRAVRTTRATGPMAASKAPVFAGMSR
jgi:hypothetical protein